MSDQEPIAPEVHKRMAVELFNHVWSLLDKKERTPEERDEMVHAAHASRFHWGKVGTPLHLARGEWQISRVYSMLGRGEPAAAHVKRCLELCEANGIGDFDLAFAHEALARAAAVAGDRAAADRHALRAKEAGELIKEKEDREYFFGELGTIQTYTTDHGPRTTADKEPTLEPRSRILKSARVSFVSRYDAEIWVGIVRAVSLLLVSGLVIGFVVFVVVKLKPFVAGFLLGHAHH